VEPERALELCRGSRDGCRHPHAEPRLFPEELACIVDDARDKVIVVDESLLEVFEHSVLRVISRIIVMLTKVGRRPERSTTSRSSPAASDPVARSTNVARR
jgi:hypothetical protein